MGSENSTTKDKQSNTNVPPDPLHPNNQLPVGNSGRNYSSAIKSTTVGELFIYHRRN
jgi:hypothetical protein